MGGRDIAAVLGGRKVLGRTAVTAFEFTDLVGSGLPHLALEHVKNALKLTDREISNALDISGKTVSRLRHASGHRLSPSISDRLYRFARLFALAEEVLEDKEQARDWLRSPQIGLNNRTPLDLMRTEAGAREVESLLVRIEHGVLS